MKILITGSGGFVAGYLIDELLSHGHEVVGIDNLSKYGRLLKDYSDNPRYTFVEGDAKNVDLLMGLIADCDQIVAGAALVGGVSYFYSSSYDILAENERITAATFDASIHAFKNKKLKKINVISSSMVFEKASIFPTPEREISTSVPPTSTYGFQKLSCEYFARGAWNQHRLPYTIIRPANCVGIGESRSRSGSEIISGNIKLTMSHVIPDLVQKIIKGQDPVYIFGDGSQVRNYIYGADLAQGIRLCIEKAEAINEDFNLSTGVSTDVLTLARLIWQKINPEKEFRYICAKPFQYDVKNGTLAAEKAKNLLGFEATTTLDEILNEVIPWVKKKVDAGEL